MEQFLHRALCGKLEISSLQQAKTYPWAPSPILRLNQDTSQRSQDAHTDTYKQIISFSWTPVSLEVHILELFCDYRVFVDVFKRVMWL